VTVEDGWEGRDKGENWALRVAHIMWAGRGARGWQYNTKTSSDSTAYYWAERQWHSWGIWW